MSAHIVKHLKRVYLYSPARPTYDRMRPNFLCPGVGMVDIPALEAGAK